jgi:BA14K-like protein
MAATSAISLGSAGANAATVVIGSHAAWCSQNYRSYNALTDSYVGFDGVVHRCISPAVIGGVQTFATVSPFVIAPDFGTTGADNPDNPNGQGSGTAFRLYPNDEENMNNGTSDPAKL